MRARIGARTALVGITAAALAATAFTASARAQQGDRTPQRPEVQRAMDAIVASGIPGVTAQVREGNRVWKGTSGVGDRRTGKPRGTNDKFRIASITKTFVATVMLQLEAEGRLGLGDTVEKHLPGLVRGNGHDGRKITVRQLLEHTSGVYDFLNDTEYRNKYMAAGGFLKHRYDYRSPQVAVATAMKHPPGFEPGTDYAYSNTNYVLAALIMEKVTGSTYEREVRERVIEPLGLRATTAPGNRSRMELPSSRAYSKLSFDPAATRIHDVTHQNASQSWAEGDMISDSRDLNRFYRALLGGKLLPAAQLKKMKTISPASDDAGSGYGLGLERNVLTCGKTKKTIFGHGGGWIGSTSYSATSEDGSRSFTFNLNGDWSDGGLAELLTAGFCDGAEARAGASAAEPDTGPRGRTAAREAAAGSGR
ncbi:serine hydrolase domain-containing protein [Streptomyces sp. CAU 1734]|uniref:serine hydrolase domain-containing protein n=1 Tax=Streptomyces sp. CAU 1734 TaxID=3140360 RepID=UPI003261B235